MKSLQKAKPIGVTHTSTVSERCRILDRAPHDRRLWKGIKGTTIDCNSVSVPGTVATGNNTET